MTPRFQAVLGGIPDDLPGVRMTPGGAASPHQSVAENVMLGIEPTRFGFIRRRVLDERAGEYLRAVGWRGDLRATLSGHDTVDCRRVQLAHAVAVAELHSEPAVLIDDTGEELSRDDNVRWQEALACAAKRVPLLVALSTLDDLHPDVAGVLVRRRARLVGPFEPSDAVGLSAALALDEAVSARPTRTPGEVLLHVRGLRVMHPVTPGRVVFSGISLGARAGQVTGLAGTHAHELLASLSGSGFGEIAEGTVTASGADLVGLSREKAIDSGVVFTTEHPLSYEVGFIGGIPSRVSADRLRTLARTGMIDAGREYRQVTSPSLLQAVGVRRSPSRDQFDGMLETLVTGPARVVLIAEPLLGLGVDDRAERIAVIARMTAAGKAVVVSASPDDLAVLADEAVIVVHGRVRETITRGSITSAALWRSLLL